jgi:membrane protease YdiL (CAAX protease family)
LLKVLLWFVATVIATDVFTDLYLRTAPQDWKAYWPLVPEVSLALVLLGWWWHTQQLFKSSQWQLRRRALIIAIAAGLALGVFQIVVTGHDELMFGLPQYSGLSIVLLGPALEEMLFRGIFQESLEAKINNWAAILLVSALAALAHQHFWKVLVSQLVFGALYSFLGRSLPCPMIAHALSNGVLVFYPVLRRIALN